MDGKKDAKIFCKKIVVGTLSIELMFLKTYKIYLNFFRKHFMWDNAIIIVIELLSKRSNQQGHS